MIAFAVEPLLHWIESALVAFAVSVTEPPAQKVVGPDAVMETAGDTPASTVFDPLALQPLGRVTVAFTVTGDAVGVK